MKIEHVAIWVSDLEKMKAFYLTYFNGKANEKYENPVKKFSSYFISFSDGCRLELMKRVDVVEKPLSNDLLGITHLAFSSGSRENVMKLTEQLRLAGYTIASEPRMTGDGYFESVILDPEGNPIEIIE